MKQCPKCRGPVADDAQFCPICGQEIDKPVVPEEPAPVPEPVPPPAPQPPKPAAGSIQSCPVCRWPLSQGADRCPTCGHMVGTEPTPEEIEAFHRREEEKRSQSQQPAQQPAQPPVRPTPPPIFSASPRQDPAKAEEAFRAHLARAEKYKGIAEGLEKKIKAAKRWVLPLLAVAVLLVVGGWIAQQSVGDLTYKRTLEPEEIPMYTPEAEKGTVVHFKVKSIEDFFVYTSTRTTTMRNSYSSNYLRTARPISSTTTYYGLVEFSDEDENKIFISFYLPDADSLESKLIEKYENIVGVELGDYTYPLVREPFTITGELKRLSSVISSSNMNAASLSKYNLIKDIPLLDTDKATLQVEEPYEGRKERLELFKKVTTAGIVLLAVGALCYYVFIVQIEKRRKEAMRQATMPF
ncbi:MAG: zinc ribbon domain-containing protein [Clostridia bacterium]|nr:zinc ribbon domain-containing protein [Clostridia bacterium]